MVTWIVLVASKAFSFAVVTVEACTISNPKYTLRIFIDGCYFIVAYTLGVGGIMCEMGKLIPLSIIAIKSAIERANPKCTQMIFVDNCYPIVSQAVRIIRVVSVNREVLPVVFI